MGMSKIVIVIVMWQIICVVNADVSPSIIKDKGKMKQKCESSNLNLRFTTCKGAGFAYIGSFKSSQNSTQLGQRFDENDFFVSTNVVSVV